MPESLRVIALISGGKDSFFSILHCLHHGHKVVALANLRPPTDVEDMDSMTYQTVGHNVIPLYGQCTNIPVFQRTIRGTTVCDHQDYTPPSGADGSQLDETEDLLELLSTVRQAIPEANAVSTGAILSTYQRTRVESVVIRMGMIPLAYLWQYPFLPPPPEREDSATGLLDDMRAAGCHARLVKIASFGIYSTLLGENLSSPRTINSLVKGLRRILVGDEAELRAAVLGEGGEYETLTVNGPGSLWKQKIVWSGQNSKQGGDVHYAALEDPKTVPQDLDENVPEAAVRIPAAFDRQFLDARTALQHRNPKHTQTDTITSLSKINIRDVSKEIVHPTLHYSLAVSTDHVSISNITAANNATDSDHSTTFKSSSAAEQMSSISNAVHSILQSLSIQLGRTEPDRSLTAENVTSSTLLLSSMDVFAQVNVHYGKLFSSINPPVRVTIATDLGDGVKVSLSVIVDLRPRSTRRALHVQSRSYWAPANIGPYSQAVAEPLLCSTKASNETQLNGAAAELVSFAGQIPLVPISMELAQDNPLANTLLSLQHLWRVAQERKSDFWTWGIAFFGAKSATAATSSEQAAMAYEVWREVHMTPTRQPVLADNGDDEDDSKYDIWDRTHNRAQPDQSTTQPDRERDQHMHVLPNWDVIKARQQQTITIPPFVAAEVSQLPRNAPIEWWSTGLGRLPRGREARLTQHSTAGQIDGVFHSTIRYDGGPSEHEHEATTFSSSFTSIFVTLAGCSRHHHHHQRTISQAIKDIVQKDRHVVVSGHCLIASSEGWELYDQLISSEPSQSPLRGMAVIPCHSLWAAIAAGGGGSNNSGGGGGGGGGSSNSGAASAAELATPEPLQQIEMALFVRTERGSSSSP